MDTPQGHPALESVMLLIVADFTLKSAILHPVGSDSGAVVSTVLGMVGRKMAELLMKSAIVESGA